MNRVEIGKRVPHLVEALLSEKGYAAPVDLLLKLGWLQPEHYEAWRFGRIPCLERVVRGSLNRLSFTMREFRRYARKRGLRPSWTAYMSWGSKRRRPLRFSLSGQAAIEQAYATHWLPQKRRAEPVNGTMDRQGDDPCGHPDPLPGSFLRHGLDTT